MVVLVVPRWSIGHGGLLEEQTSWLSGLFFGDPQGLGGDSVVCDPFGLAPWWMVTHVCDHSSVAATIVEGDSAWLVGYVVNRHRWLHLVGWSSAAVVERRLQ